MKLHLYGQQQWHDDAWIVGDRETLTALRDHLNYLLNGSNTSTGFGSSCEDGEGYLTFIVLAEDPKAWQTLQLPYSKWGVTTDDETIKSPYELFGDRYMTIAQNVQDKVPIQVLTPGEKDLRAMCDAATRGPWCQDKYPDLDRVRGPVYNICEDLLPQDAVFVAVARMALPEALDTIAALRAERAELLALSRVEKT